MADTLERSLRSILDQITDDFEVLVVDGGSTDGSLDILAWLDEEYEALRYITLEPEPKRHLGGDRDISVKEANGDYLLLHLDTDDYYEDAIVDFVEVYHQVENQLDRQLVMIGSHVTMVEKDHFLELGSYRNLRAAEDIDLWRRAVADDKTELLVLRCTPFWQPIGYKKSTKQKVSRALTMKSSEFQTGISLSSYVHWDLTEGNGMKIVYNLLTTLLAYLLALRRESFHLPPEVRQKGATSRGMRVERDQSCVRQLKQQYDIELDVSELRPETQQYFLQSSANQIS